MSSPLPPILRPLGPALSLFYGLAVRRAMGRWDVGKGVRRVERPVISVGNITAGGVGKSPMVGWMVDTLRAAGHQPAIAMRGYGARSDAPSDEAVEHSERHDDVPVVADPDRHAALSRFLPENPDIDCIVLDDGFQHRRLHRDLDVVLIDAQAKTFHDHLLPRGYLREPLEALRRADAVVITHTDRVDAELTRAVERYHGRPPVAWTKHTWSRLRVHGRDGSEDHGTEWLRGRRVLTLLGVGRPERVRAMVESHGGEVVVDVPARDHERFTEHKLAQARSRAFGLDAIFMTAKDWVRSRQLIDLSACSTPIVVPKLELRFTEGEQALKERIVQTVEAPANPPAVA